jgi:hypothetical protein
VEAPDSALAKLPPLAVDGLYGALSKQALEVYKASLTTKPVENPVVPQPEAPQPKNEEIRDEITITDELKIVIREFELLMDDIDFVDAEFWERLDNAKNDTEVGILFEEFNKAYNTSINSFDPCDYLLPTAIVDADIKSINFDGVKQLVSIEAYQSLLTQKPVWETGLDTYKNSIPKKIEIINFDGVNKNLDTFTEADLCQIDKNSAFYEVYKLVRTAVKTYIPAIKKNNKDENAIKFLENIVKSAFANISKFPQKYATLKTLGKKVKDNELVKFEEFIGLFTHTDFYNFEPKIELLNKKLKKVVLNPYKEFKALEKKVLKPKNIASS